MSVQSKEKLKIIKSEYSGRGTRKRNIKNRKYVFSDKEKAAAAGRKSRKTKNCPLKNYLYLQGSEDEKRKEFLTYKNSDVVKLIKSALFSTEKQSDDTIADDQAPIFLKAIYSSIKKSVDTGDYFHIKELVDRAFGSNKQLVDQNLSVIGDDMPHSIDVNFIEKEEIMTITSNKTLTNE